ncbi:DUF2809 domain-containing protein [Gangjinia marincola]|uniref:ribosomal maturation YjgA family protein n=1 Tax=Gangjinia marincola TaxID=578463 RepID=UPI0031D3E341
MRFNPTSFYLFILLLVLEVIIALFVTHPFIRGFVGDVLVVMLMICALHTFLPNRCYPCIGVAWIFAVAVECVQYTGITQHLTSDHKLLRIILGNTFDVFDLLAYSLGAVVSLVLYKHVTHDYTQLH